MSQQNDKQRKPFGQRRQPLWLSVSAVSSTMLVGISAVPSELRGALIAPAIAQVDPAADPGAGPSAQDLLPSPVVPAPAPAAPSVAPPEVLPAPAVAPLEVAPAPSANRLAPAAAPTNFDDLYIDPTRYQVGATKSPHADVVLSERSTGCETVLQPGQSVPASPCASGAGQSFVAGDSPNAIRIGPVSFSRNGIAINSFSVQDFYNRTIRPLALPGNGNARLIFPLSMPAVITSVFGWRLHPIHGTVRFHSGTDIGAPMGTPVVAAYSGRVGTADFLQGYGLTVVLEHNNNTQQTLYGHLSEIFVRPGTWVKQGEVIGRVGSTGNSTGPHLHFEFHQLTDQGWVALDPGSLLENGLTNFMQPLQTAEARPLTPAIALNIKSLQDFGKLASDARPEPARKEQP
jgi:murein DD-endopeptidase MepM/ murein hydrolase activator NlpD